jgi:UDP-glucose 4-epimerase
MRTCLVTGGAGFIGSHLADALVARGDRVRIIDDLSTGNRANLNSIRERVEFFHASLLDAEAVKKAVAGVDCIFHEAALASVPRSLEKPLDTNAACVTATVTLLEAAQKAGVRRVVYAGSSSAYGNQPFTSKRETDMVAPISPYGAAKMAGELYCQAFAASFPIETVAIRYFNVFGPRQDPNSEYSAVIPKFITAILRGQSPTVYGDGLQSRDFTFVANVVAGNLLAADAPGVSGRVFNVAMGGSVNLLQLIDSINRLLGTSVKPIHAPPRAGDVRDSQADITAARSALGYEPVVQFDEGLSRSIDYYKSLAR